MNCGEQRELAAHGLCFKCYRRQDRAEEQRFSGIDRHSPAIRRQDKKLLAGFACLMRGLSDLSAPREIVDEVRRRVQPLLEPIQGLLNAAKTENEHSAYVSTKDITTNHANVSATEEKQPRVPPAKANDANNGVKILIARTLED